MKALVALLVSATTLGGIWLVQRSLTANHAWYWIVVEIVLIVFGIAAQLVVVQKDEEKASK